MDLKVIVPQDETILYDGKPDKTVNTLENIFNFSLFLCILWLVLGTAIMEVVSYINIDFNILYVILSIFIYFTPINIFIVNIIKAILEYKNIEYIITDKNIYISYGIFQHKYKIIGLSGIENIFTERGIFDKLYNTGDITICYKNRCRNRNNHYEIKITFLSLPDYQKPLDILKKHYVLPY